MYLRSLLGYKRPFKRTSYSFLCGGKPWSPVSCPVFCKSGKSRILNARVLELYAGHREWWNSMINDGSWYTTFIIQLHTVLDEQRAKRVLVFGPIKEFKILKIRQIQGEVQSRPKSHPFTVILVVFGSLQTYQQWPTICMASKTVKRPLISYAGKRSMILNFMWLFMLEFFFRNRAGSHFKMN